MQKTSLLTIFLAAALFGLSIYTVYQHTTTKEQLQALEQKINAPVAPTTPHDHEAEEEEHEYPLGEKMGKMLYYLHKAGLAGKYENWELAAFYTHELEETAEAIIEAKVEDEGIKVSELVANVKEHIEKMEAAAKNKDAVEFPKTYQTLIRNCNNCHIAANKPYVVIEPLQKDIEGQKFKK